LLGSKKNALARNGPWWEIAHMITLVTADAKGRIPIRRSKPEQKYMVSQTGGEWRVTPFAESGYASRNSRERSLPKGKGKLSEHLKALWDLGLRLERADNAKAPVPPCRF
jgi:hypothetical protein